MNDLPPYAEQIRIVNNFDALISTSFYGKVNAVCWSRRLQGDFSEIVAKTEHHTNITELSIEELRSLNLTEQGSLARDIILKDLELLKDHGASPILNLINKYERDSQQPLITTDVYSFHADRSPIPTDTYLCTYYGRSSEIISNSDAEKKIHIPEIRAALKKIYDGSPENFDNFLAERFYDLHYREKPGAQIMSLGNGHLWKLAVDHPQSQVPPCIHRAPVERSGETRLLLIC